MSLSRSCGWVAEFCLLCGSFEWNGKCGKFLLGQVYSAQGCGKCCEGGVGILVVQVQPVPGWVSIERGTESCKFVCGGGILVVQVQPVPVLVSIEWGTESCKFVVGHVCCKGG